VEQPLISQVSAVSPLRDSIDGAARPKVRKAAAARKVKPGVDAGRLCPICRQPFYEFGAFAQHVWDETPAYAAELEADASVGRFFKGIVANGEEVDRQQRQALRDLICLHLTEQPHRTLPQIASALRYYGDRRRKIECELDYLLSAGNVTREQRAGNLRLTQDRAATTGSRITKSGIAWRYALTPVT
jgi:hypothetical protein